jgi:hypothetical protein
MQQQFLFEADQQSHFPISQTVNDTIALYSSPMRRLADLGADALTEIDALSLLLDASDSTLAGELLAEYGSLTGLARASLANLRRFLPQTKAARLVAALRLGTLACKDPLTQEHFDNPESVYKLSVRKCAPLIVKSSQSSCLIPVFGSSSLKKFRKVLSTRLLRIPAKFSNPPSFTPRMPSSSYTTYE